jgi:hypothetical protein
MERAITGAVSHLHHPTGSEMKRLTFVGAGQPFVARGFTPVRLRSSRKTSVWGIPETPRSTVLAPLRDPTGVNPLATRLGGEGRNHG